MSEVDRIQNEIRARLAQYRAAVDGRDDLVTLAYANRLSKREIHQLTGLARTTIDTILADSMGVTAGNGDGEGS
jgi:hypothetical protein